MTDREERQHVIEVLERLMQAYERNECITCEVTMDDEDYNALRYAVSSIKTDLKYDLLYEETSGQADKPTTKNDLGVDKARSDSELIARGDVLNTIKETAQYHTGDSFNADRLIRYIKELPSVTPQEPMVEIDLYSVIKQKYIERDVLDKIRAEIKSKLDNINRLYNQDNQYDDGAIDSLQYALDIIDKYRESEDKE